MIKFRSHWLARSTWAGLGVTVIGWVGQKIWTLPTTTRWNQRGQGRGGAARLSAATLLPMSATGRLTAARSSPIVENDWPTSVNGAPTRP
jgi:hypothetical protein